MSPWSYSFIPGLNPGASLRCLLKLVLSHGMRNLVSNFVLSFPKACAASIQVASRKVASLPPIAHEVGEEIVKQQDEKYATKCSPLCSTGGAVAAYVSRALSPCEDRIHCDIARHQGVGVAIDSCFMIVGERSLGLFVVELPIGQPVSRSLVLSQIVNLFGLFLHILSVCITNSRLESRILFHCQI